MALTAKIKHWLKYSLHSKDEAEEFIATIDDAVSDIASLEAKVADPVEDLPAPVAASLVVGDLTFVAVAPGVGGNDITITLADDATAESESVDVSGNDITVHIEASFSTAAMILAALEAESDATDLVTTTIATGEEDTVQLDALETPLAGGYDNTLEDCTDKVNELLAALRAAGLLDT